MVSRLKSFSSFLSFISAIVDIMGNIVSSGRGGGIGGEGEGEDDFHHSDEVRVNNNTDEDGAPERVQAEPLNLGPQGEPRGHNSGGEDDPEERSTERVQAEVKDLGPNDEVRVYTNEYEDEREEGHLERVQAELLEVKRRLIAESEGLAIAHLEKKSMESPLYIAARDGNEEEVKLLLEKVDVNEEDALYIAAKFGHIKVVEALLKMECIEVNKTTGCPEVSVSTLIAHISVQSCSIRKSF